MNYVETDIERTRGKKENFLNSIHELIKSKEEDAKKVRAEYAKEIFKNPEKCRDDLKHVLGWPFTAPKFDLPTASYEELFVDEVEGYTIYRVDFTMLDTIKLCGVLFKMHGEEKRPMVIALHGGLGNPEVISGFNNGKTVNYNDMVDRVLKHKVNVFAPQFVHWEEELGPKFSRDKLDSQFKRLGGTLCGFELYCIISLIDYFETQDYVSTFGTVGLSYGGFYSLYTAALDTRVKSVLSTAYFSDRDLTLWPDWAWMGEAYKFNDAETAWLCYPRNLCLTMGNRDKAFNPTLSAAAYQTVLEYCDKFDVDRDWISYYTFDGGHEFIKDDTVVEKFVKALF